MPGTSQQEWLNQNAGRAYPFQEDMQRIPVDSNGAALEAAQLPNYVVTDMVFTVPGTVSCRVYMSQLTYVGTLMTLVFRETVNSTVVTSVTLDLAAHTRNKAYAMLGTGAWEDARGWIVIGDLTRLPQDLPQGLYTYAAAQTLLETRVTRPALRGVRSLRVENNGAVSALLFDHVKLLAGANMRLRVDETLNGIWLDAEPNAGYKEECPCGSVVQENVVHTINGIAAETVTIVGDGSCVEVSTSSNRISIRDKCSEPCCGCPELDFLTQTNKILETSLSRLEAYSEKLSERLSTFVSNFVITTS